MDELKQQIEELDTQIADKKAELESVQTEVEDLNTEIGEKEPTEEQAEALGTLEGREITLLQDINVLVMKQNALLKQIADIEAEDAMNEQNKEEDN